MARPIRAQYYMSRPMRGQYYLDVLDEVELVHDYGDDADDPGVHRRRGPGGPASGDQP